MKNIVLNIFNSIGVACTILLIVVTIMILKEKITDFIDAKKYEYRRKRRFDKPPLAQCYCKDCVIRKENGLCGFGNINNRADNWFCADARPRSTNPDKEA